jgi:hypothetical protein
MPVLRPELICQKRAQDLSLTNKMLIMSNVGKEPSSASDLLKNSTLYREFQAEREEILKHKWIESEKAGHDIGFERALTDWIIKHRAKWRKSRPGPTHN